MMVLFAAVRGAGGLWFRQEYINAPISFLAAYAVMAAFNITEKVFVLKILADVRWKKALIVAAAMFIPLTFTNNYILHFIMDTSYYFSLPFVFNQDKERSILNSAKLFAGVFIYQAIMMYGRYDMQFWGKYDVIYQLLSTFDYRLFLPTIYLYQKMGGVRVPPGCMLLWGPFEELCKLIGLILIAVICTPFVFITPCYLVAIKAYKAIPLQYKAYCMESRKNAVKG